MAAYISNICLIFVGNDKVFRSEKFAHEKLKIYVSMGSPKHVRLVEEIFTTEERERRGCTEIENLLRVLYLCAPSLFSLLCGEYFLDQPYKKR